MSSDLSGWELIRMKGPYFFSLRLFIFGLTAVDSWCISRERSSAKCRHKLAIHTFLNQIILIVFWHDCFVFRRILQQLLNLINTLFCFLRYATKATTTKVAIWRCLSVEDVCDYQTETNNQLVCFVNNTVQMNLRRNKSWLLGDKLANCKRCLGKDFIHGSYYGTLLWYFKSKKFVDSFTWMVTLSLLWFCMKSLFRHSCKIFNCS